MSELRARLNEIQGELDGLTSRIEELRTEQDELSHRIEEITAETRSLEQRRARLLDDVVARADELYRSGGTDLLEVVFSAEDLSQLTARVEVLSRVSARDSGIFVQMARSTEELQALNRELASRQSALDDTEDALASESDRLQSTFEEVSAEYEDLLSKLTPAAPSTTGTTSTFVARSTDGMTCPVAGPVSFIDSWGAPRAGHTHQGVDLMAEYGTPVVAIVSGTITYSGYGDSAGYWQILSGDDGHSYWYMHNQTNIVNGGHVEVGQQIATVGDTGNAAGTPHVHFEYHPGGGAAVNPYPLVAPIC